MWSHHCLTRNGGSAAAMVAREMPREALFSDSCRLATSEQIGHWTRPSLPNHEWNKSGINRTARPQPRRCCAGHTVPLGRDGRKGTVIQANFLRALTSSQGQDSIAVVPFDLTPRRVQDARLRVARHCGHAASHGRRLSRDGQAAQAAGRGPGDGGLFDGRARRANPQTRRTSAQEQV